MTVGTDHGPPLVTNASYRAAINALPHVHGQGDGIKSFVGLSLLLTSTEYPIALVDEPEAFLHPPQARLLGRTLTSAAATTNTQLIVATHSLDILRGMLEADLEHLTVVRLTRVEAYNRASVLAPERVRSLWSDPLLRFTNVLDGVFHRGVVICEADGDARFYDATLSAAQKSAGESEHGLQFTHCGGKARVNVVARALDALDVPVRVVCDIDVLREENPLRAIVEQLGGLWADIEPDWRVVKSAVDSQARGNPSVESVRGEILRLFDETTEPRLTETLQRRVREVTKADDGWSFLKRAGFLGLPKGDAAAAMSRLDSQLRGVGLYIPPVGELEGWAPELGGHGPTWVIRAIEQGIHSKEGPAAEFVRAIAMSFE